MLVSYRRRAISAIGAIATLTVLVGTEVALPGTFHVNPIRITLSPKSSSSLLTVRNDSTEKVRFQVGVFEWNQTPQGEMLLTATDDLIFYPNLLAIEPGEERNIRVGANKSIVATEKSYRIFVEELPPAEKSDHSGIRILTKMGIPVFIQPAKQTVQAQIDEMKMGGGEFSFEIRNAGNVHFFPRNIRVQGSGPQGETMLANQLQPWYILSGGVRKYSIEIPQEDCPKLQSLTVEVELEGKSLKETFSMPLNVCKG
jgi:fimbrial chaperone protein